MDDRWERDIKKIKMRRNRPFICSFINIVQNDHMVTVFHEGCCLSVTYRLLKMLFYFEIFQCSSWKSLSTVFITQWWIDNYTSNSPHLHDLLWNCFWDFTHERKTTAVWTWFMNKMTELNILLGFEDTFPGNVTLLNVQMDPLVKTTNSRFCFFYTKIC